MQIDKKLIKSDNPLLLSRILRFRSSAFAENRTQFRRMKRMIAVYGKIMWKYEISDIVTQKCVFEG